MDKNKILSIFFWLSLFSAIIFGAYRFFFARDFLVTYQIDCDPKVENCFVGHCDPSFNECTGNEDDDIWYYAKVKKMAYNVKQCNPNKEECPDESICDHPLQQHCWVEKCDPNNIGEDEECSDPKTYLATHPDALEEEDEEGLKGEEEEAAEGDESEGDETMEEGAPNENSSGATLDKTTEVSEDSIPTIIPEANILPVSPLSSPSPSPMAPY